MHNRSEQGDNMRHDIDNSAIRKIRKGEIPTGIIIAIVIGLIVVFVIVSISGSLGERAKDITPLANETKDNLKEAMHDKKCAMDCTAHCIDDSYVVPTECWVYVITSGCCDCDGVRDIAEGCDDVW